MKLSGLVLLQYWLIIGEAMFLIKIQKNRFCIFFEETINFKESFAFSPG